MWTSEINVLSILLDLGNYLGKNKFIYYLKPTKNSQLYLILISFFYTLVFIAMLFCILQNNAQDNQSMMEYLSFNIKMKIWPFEKL